MIDTPLTFLICWFYLTYLPKQVRPVRSRTKLALDSGIISLFPWVFNFIPIGIYGDIVIFAFIWSYIYSFTLNEKQKILVSCKIAIVPIYIVFTMPLIVMAMGRASLDLPINNYIAYIIGLSILAVAIYALLLFVQYIQKIIANKK